jgi:PPOX class probable F420-dependent enzyme
VVNLATVNADGSPQVHPVWVGKDGNDILVNSAKGRAKDRNMRARPIATVLAVDPKNPYRWIEVRGDVVEITHEGADAAIEEFSHRYLGKAYPFRQPGEERVLYRIRPRVIHSMA